MTDKFKEGDRVRGISEGNYGEGVVIDTEGDGIPWIEWDEGGGSYANDADLELVTTTDTTEATYHFRLDSGEWVPLGTPVEGGFAFPKPLLDTIEEGHAGTLPTESYSYRDDEPDMVHHPPHYTSDPSGVECIEVTRFRTFNIGNAIKYLWRAGLKGDPSKEVEDLRKAVFYINDEIERLTAQ